MQPQDEVGVTSKRKLWPGHLVLLIGGLLCVLLLVVVVLVSLRSGDRHYAKLRNPDLEYLKSVNSVARRIYGPARMVVGRSVGGRRVRSSYPPLRAIEFPGWLSQQRHTPEALAEHEPQILN